MTIPDYQNPQPNSYDRAFRLITLSVILILFLCDAAFGFFAMGSGEGSVLFLGLLASPLSLFGAPVSLFSLVYWLVLLIFLGSEKRPLILAAGAMEIAHLGGIVIYLLESLRNDEFYHAAHVLDLVPAYVGLWFIGFAGDMR